MVGAVATTEAMRGRPSSSDSSPKKSPGPSSAIVLSVPDHPGRPRGDQEEAGPDLALADDRPSFGEVDLDGSLGDHRQALRADAVEQGDSAEEPGVLRSRHEVSIVI